MGITFRMTMLAVSTAIFLMYTAFIGLRYGVRPSISDSYYSLPNGLKFLFTAFIWLFAIAFIISAATPVMFCAGSFLCFVGASQDFKDKFEGRTHFAAAYAGIGTGMLSLVTEFHNWIAPACFGLIVAVIVLSKMKNRTWWIECAAFGTIIISIFIRLLGV